MPASARLPGLWADFKVTFAVKVTAGKRNTQCVIVFSVRLELLETHRTERDLIFFIVSVSSMFKCGLKKQR